MTVESLPGMSPHYVGSAGDRPQNRVVQHAVRRHGGAVAERTTAEPVGDAAAGLGDDRPQRRGVVRLEADRVDCDVDGAFGDEHVLPEITEAPRTVGIAAEVDHALVAADRLPAGVRCRAHLCFVERRNGTDTQRSATVERTHADGAVPPRADCRCADDTENGYVVRVEQRDECRPHGNTARVVAGAVDRVEHPRPARATTCAAFAELLAVHGVIGTEVNNCVGKDFFGAPVEVGHLGAVRLPVDGEPAVVERLQRCRIGEVGEGFTIAMHTLDRSRPTIGAQAVGIAQGAIDYAVAYMKERKTFGSALATRQGLQWMVAEAQMQVEAARTLVYRACAAVDAGDPHGDLSTLGAMAKCFASDVAMQVTTDCVQLLGGYGYTNDFPVERMMRDAKITQIYEGTNQIQRMVIAKKVFG